MEPPRGGQRGGRGQMTRAPACGRTPPCSAMRLGEKLTGSRASDEDLGQAIDQECVGRYGVAKRASTSARTNAEAGPSKGDCAGREVVGGRLNRRSNSARSLSNPRGEVSRVLTRIARWQ